ncbi:MAG: hypothetical protein CL916_10025 [Deltaproteobacteria bacterium]|nr:hypothetical protein [Deltaproteobacteria bacterium]
MVTIRVTMWQLSLVVLESRSAQMRAETKAVRHACQQHPFVLGIADGSLAPVVFVRWVVQDWRYLLTYVEVLEELATLAPTEEVTRYWNKLAEFTRKDELVLHRVYAKRFGISEQELDHAKDAPATIAYTAFLRAQVKRSYAHGVASLVPCGVGYITLATELAKGPLPKDDRYADWIRSYSDESFAQAVAWMEKELDGVSGDESELAATYRQGAQHELDFWEQLWTGWESV